MGYKGQSSVELTLVVSMSLLLASPFIMASQSSVIQLKQSTDLLQIDNSLDKIENSAKTLNKKSYPARRNIEVSIPQGVQAVYSPQYSNQSALIFEVRSGGTETNQSRIFDFNITVSEPRELANEGNHRVSLKKYKHGVNASVVS